MLAPVPIPLMKIEDFLDWASTDTQSWELYDGHPVAMAPTRPGHQLLAANLARRIGEALDAKPPCTVRVEAPITLDDRDDVCYVADLAVTCRPHDPRDRVTPEPILIVEILSPSTEDDDRKVKLPDYRSLASVREIVLIDPRRMYCEVHRRLDGDRWLTDLLRNSKSRLRLTSIDFDQKLETIYANVSFR